MKLGSAGEAYFLHDDPSAAAAVEPTLPANSVLADHRSASSLISPTSLSPDASDTEADNLRNSLSLSSAPGDLPVISIADSASVASKFEVRLRIKSVPSAFAFLASLSSNQLFSQNHALSPDSSDASLAGVPGDKRAIRSYSSSPASQSSPVGSPPVAGSQILEAPSSSQAPADVMSTPGQQSGSRWTWGWGSLPKRTKGSAASDTNAIPAHVPSQEAAATSLSGSPSVP